MRQRMSPRPSKADPARTGYRQLIQLLNQRYRQEFDRAEQLRSELADIYASRAWRLLSWLRNFKRRWFPGSAKGACRPEAQKTGMAARETPPRAARVSIVIPFRDRIELLCGCLTSLRRSTYRRFEVILVDNGSTDARTLGYVDRLRLRRRYRVVVSPGPFNFSRLCNEGARQAAGDYLLFLNNDIEVFAPDWLEQLLIVAQQPQVGVVGATLLYPDLTIQHTGIFERGGAWVHVYRGRPHDHEGDHGELRQVRAVPAVTGACLLIGRELFFQVGGFDESLAVTHNDVDLCRRVRERGYLVAITPHAQLLHYESLSRGYSAEHQQR